MGGEKHKVSSVWGCEGMIGVFFLMIRRPPRSTQSRSSAASDVYKRQFLDTCLVRFLLSDFEVNGRPHAVVRVLAFGVVEPVSYTHLRAHETVLDLVCRLLLEKTKNYFSLSTQNIFNHIVSHLTHYHSTAWYRHLDAAPQL